MTGLIDGQTERLRGPDDRASALVIGVPGQFGGECAAVPDPDVEGIIRALAALEQVVRPHQGEPTAACRELGQDRLAAGARDAPVAGRARAGGGPARAVEPDRIDLRVQAGEGLEGDEQ